jgi:hypothetical protein
MTGMTDVRDPAANARRDPADPPFVDEHHTTIAAPRDAVWAALRGYADSSLRVGEHSLVARLLGTVPSAGFAVSRELPYHQLRLAGRHRFSRYLLVFELTTRPDGQTRLSARTYATFPGLLGGVYRALVIGSRFHVVAVRRMLRSIRRSSLAGLT